jgi:elongation of very long chain fatty acids protein 6
MNYGVHSIMYFYYFLTNCGYRPSWAKVVTVLQISQMFVGMGVCASVAYFKFGVRGGGPLSSPFALSAPPFPPVAVELTLPPTHPFTNAPPLQLNKECDNTNENLVAGFIMYGSYFALFAQFFTGRYKDDRPAKVRPAKQDAPAPAPAPQAAKEPEQPRGKSTAVAEPPAASRRSKKAAS